jgi:hypothetical protein
MFHLQWTHLQGGQNFNGKYSREKDDGWQMIDDRENSLALGVKKSLVGIEH